MSGAPRHQALPSSGPEREALRRTGQFWTPDWVADAMATYVLCGGSDHIFDPAVGGGAFFRAAKGVARDAGRDIALLGTELHAHALVEAAASGLTAADLQHVQRADFIRQPPDRTFSAIVANPPYIRHHRLPEELKAFLRRYAHELLGAPLDGRAGLHIYFLLRALQHLAPGGRLAFIMPADTCEGIFAASLWRWIARHYRLVGVVTFRPEASPFPGVDTNPVVLLIQHAAPEREFLWASVERRGAALRAWCQSCLKATSVAGLTVVRRAVVEGISTGLSRPPRAPEEDTGVPLRYFAHVMRGIATGANHFFCLTRADAARRGLPAAFLHPVVGRTRDVPGTLVTIETLDELERQGRPSLLLSPDGRPMRDFPPAVRDYLAQGEADGIPSRTLIAARNPWYKMEVRRPPPFLFAYLGRRSARFVHNLAHVVPLTGFLCVYPTRSCPAFTELLWRVLQHPDTIRNLDRVGKSYGGGAIKVEPRALEQLPLPGHVLAEVGLEPPAADPQLAWFA